MSNVCYRHHTPHAVHAAHRKSRFRRSRRSRRRLRRSPRCSRRRRRLCRRQRRRRSRQRRVSATAFPLPVFDDEVTAFPPPVSTKSPRFNRLTLPPSFLPPSFPRYISTTRFHHNPSTTFSIRKNHILKTLQSLLPPIMPHILFFSENNNDCGENRDFQSFLVVFIL